MLYLTISCSFWIKRASVIYLVIYYSCTICCYYGKTITRSDEATKQDTFCILHTKNLIDKNLKLLCENNELVDDEVSATPVPGSPNTPTKDTNKISDIVLNDIKKDLMRHVNSEVENLKALIHKEFTTIRRSIEDLKRTNFITDNMSLIRKYNYNRNYKISYSKKSTCCAIIFAK